MKYIGYLLLLAAAIIAGCAAPERLDPRAANLPADVNLTGLWRMEGSREMFRRELLAAIRDTDDIDDDKIFRSRDLLSQDPRRRSRAREAKGGLVYVFLETGSALNITQTDHALFVSFDRSVVEEFRFGENRLITIGQATAQRVSGWVNDILVVETLDRSGMKLIDQFQLLPDGETLQRSITFVSGKKKLERTVVKTFKRS